MEKSTDKPLAGGPKKSGADRKLLIAVDFGTTYSGVAWAQTTRVGVQGWEQFWTAMKLFWLPFSRMCKASSFNGHIRLPAA
jgi:hypothetical protein